MYYPLCYRLLKFVCHVCYVEFCHELILSQLIIESTCLIVRVNSFSSLLPKYHALREISAHFRSL